MVAEGQLLTTPSGWEALVLRVLEVWFSDLCRDAHFLLEVSTPEKKKMQPAVSVVLFRPSGGPQYLSCDS